MPKEESGSNKSNVVEEIEEHNLFEFTENTNTEKIRGENKGNQIEIEESPQTKEFTGQNKHKKYNNFKEKSKENSKETIKEYLNFSLYFFKLVLVFHHPPIG